MKKFENMFGVVCAVLFIWIVASFIDVNAHNNLFSENYGVLSSWNMFEIMFNLIERV